MMFCESSTGLTAFEPPFEFFIFPKSNGWIKLIIRYGLQSETQSFRCVESAIDFAHQYALRKTLDQLQRIAPAGARTTEIDGEWRFVCSGRDDRMGYRCIMNSGHDGDCYCRTKRTDFIPIRERNKL